MSDPNKDLIARVARRGDDTVTAPVPVITTADWNAPIDTIQADCLSLRSLIRGWIGDLKDEVWRWEPRPCPPIIALPPTEEIRRG